MDLQERVYRLGAMARMLVDLYQASERSIMLEYDNGDVDALYDECDHFRDVINRLMGVDKDGNKLSPDDRGE